MAISLYLEAHAHEDFEIYQKRRRSHEQANTRESETIRQSRMAKGLSQQQLATLLGVHIRQYQRLEYGERSIRKVNMGLGLSLCRTLGIDPFLLVPDEGKDKSKKNKS